MSRNHISMRNIRELLRLRFQSGLSHAKIGKSIGIGETTVSECLQRFKKACLSWPLPIDLTDGELEGKLYPSYRSDIPLTEKQKQRREIDWTSINKELKRKSVTLRLLWEEYKTENPLGLEYSQFCGRYAEWSKHLDVWMRQPHKFGEKLFVDYAGQTTPIVINKETGEVRDAQIFVATFGASNYTYAEATCTQTIPDWISSHIRAFEFFEGCPEIVVPDNLLSGVTKAHRYEPELNQSYQEMASHYNVTILPARVRAPKDKAKVENGVQQVERRVLAVLRNRKFFGIEELNQAIKTPLKTLNASSFQKTPGSRLKLFQEQERPALNPLPATRYVLAEWKKVKAGFNYHIEVEGHYYSVPFTLVRKELHVRITSSTLEIFYQNARVALHVRSYIPRGYTTQTAHMPKKHQKHAEWTPERIASWTSKTGANTEKFVEGIMNSRGHPQQGFRSCMGVLRLARVYGHQRLEAGCARAIALGIYGFKSLESIFKNSLDQAPLPNTSTLNEKIMPDAHENVRGKEYFN
jgi:transposase